MRKLLKIRTYAFLPHDLSIELFFSVHFPPSFNLNRNKKSVALLELDLHRTATRSSIIIAKTDENVKWTFAMPGTSEHLYAFDCCFKHRRGFIDGAGLTALNEFTKLIPLLNERG